MAKGITRERTGHLLRNLFLILKEEPDGLAAKETLALLAQRVPPNEYEAGEYDTGGRRYEKIVRFATVDAVKAGWMRKLKGVWTLTDLGEEALEQYPEPDEFYREATRLYRMWKKTQDEEEVTEGKGSQVKEAKITFEEAEEQALREITAYLTEMDPYHLQDLVAALLEAMGYYVSWVSPAGKDRGLDIIAWNDPLGTKPPRIKVQVKRRQDSIAVEELRSFMSLVNEDEVGIFVTTGGFTRDADELSRSQERRKITLINRQTLVDLWVEYNDRLEKDKRNLLPLKPIYFLSPDD